jgi:hypothetical protein
MGTGTANLGRGGLSGMKWPLTYVGSLRLRTVVDVDRASRWADPRMKGEVAGRYTPVWHTMMNDDMIGDDNVRIEGSQRIEEWEVIDDTTRKMMERKRKMTMRGTRLVH